MSMTAAILQEFENEAKTTRRVLERVPADKLTWRPHPKSMTTFPATVVQTAGPNRDSTLLPRAPSLKACRATSRPR